MPTTVAIPTSSVFHCFLKSSRLIIVPRCTMTNPTTTPARASRLELASRSSGKTPVRKPTRKMMEATKSEDSRDRVFFATRSLTVQTSMTMTNASTGFTVASASSGRRSGRGSSVQRGGPLRLPLGG